MEKILIGKTKLILDPRLIQISPSGREIKLIGAELVTTEPQKYINGNYVHRTIYNFKYIDNNELINFKFDYNNKFLTKL